MVPLTWYLLLAAALFCIGLFGVLARRNAVAVLMGVELMLNAVNINLIAFWRHTGLNQLGVALFIAIYRQRNTVDVEALDEMKG
jgi:NADH-quinone oxidoreductase subunit K